MQRMAEIVRGADGLLPNPPAESQELIGHVNELAAKGVGDSQRVDAMMTIFDALLERLKAQ
jgi:hypothetical protein